jgi:hypothetical protein
LADQEKIGSRTALLIGLPIGITFSFLVLFISLFAPLDIGIGFIGGRLFWHPIIWAAIIPFTFGLLLWKAGQRIKRHLDKDYSILKTSFYFTLFVNTYFFGLILLIFIIGGLLFNAVSNFSFSTFGIAFGLTTSIYVGATVFTTFTIGLLIVYITKKRYTANSVL